MFAHCQWINTDEYRETNDTHPLTAYETEIIQNEAVVCLMGETLHACTPLGCSMDK